jgi:hypothetical protein
MASEDVSMALSPALDEQELDKSYYQTSSAFHLDLLTSSIAPNPGFMSDQHVSALPTTPSSNSSASVDRARHPLIIPAPWGPRDTVFFLDHMRRLAVTHYQTKDRSTLPTTVTAPKFVLRLYIRSSTSMFNKLDALETVLNWCENMLALSAVTHLLHQLGLSGTSVRVEMYGGLNSFKVRPGSVHLLLTDEVG